MYNSVNALKDRIVSYLHDVRWTFGLSHSASSAYQKWSTWHSLAFAAQLRSSM